MRGLSIILLTLFAVILGFTNPAFTAEIKVGSIDNERLNKESKKIIEASKAVDDFAKSKKKILESDLKEIEKSQEDFKKQYSVLSPEARAQNEEKIKKKVEEFRKKEEALLNEVRKKEIDELKVIEAKIDKIVREIGKKEGFTLIIMKRGLMYSPDDFYPLDLTDRIIKEIDSQK